MRWLMVIGFFINTSLSLGKDLAVINNYRHTFVPCLENNTKQVIAIRKFKRNGQLYFLVVDPESLQTKIVLVKHLKFKNVVLLKLAQTPYLRALKTYNAGPYTLANHGVKRAQFPIEGYFFSVDMCPSSKAMELEFFQNLIAIGQKNNAPTPLALAMSGLWINNHLAEFKWLVKQRKQNRLAITWVNHSFRHVYYDGLALDQNFLLHPKIDMQTEVLDLECLLISLDETPSVFFRFPGLISNAKAHRVLATYGLIPLGADAWLAKGEPAKPGSIILVHGNSNEPEGIQKAKALLSQPNLNLLKIQDILKRQLDK